MIQLKEIRKRLGYSQKEVSRELGISTGNYSKIERGDVQLTVDRLIKLSSFYNMSPEGIIYYNGSYGTLFEMQNPNVSFIPVAAQAGLFADFSDKNILENTVQFSLPVFYEKSLFMINLEGDSMYPTFSNGDYILIQEVNGNTNIKWGEPYLIVSNNGQVVKRIYKSDEITKLLLKSDNELYDPYEIELLNIKSLWEVKGVLSKNLAPKRL